MQRVGRTFRDLCKLRWAIVVLILVQEQSIAGWADVDWVSIVPNIITGAVGLAGIGGSLVSAKMAGKSAAETLRTSLAAEDERAKLAEKRRIYANCLSSLNLGIYAASIVRTHGNKRSKEYGAAVLEANRARMVAANAINEVRLSGPPELGSLAGKVLITMLRILGEGSSREFSKALAELTFAMRVDLGEPVPGNQSHSDEHRGPGVPDISG